MGQKINPTGLRLGIIKGWESSWYGGKDFSDKIVEDHKIRNYINLRIPRGGISKVVIERTMKLLEITIHTARPGIIIGDLFASLQRRYLLLLNQHQFQIQMHQ